MTNERAISVLQAILYCATAAPEHCDGIGDCDNCKGYVAPVDDAKAYEMSINALRKQIPARPIPDREGGDEWRICPCCRETLEEYKDYCPECGQKIGWRSADNE